MLVLENVTKNFEGVIAVSDLDLRIEQGKIYGLIGPNGAGKTTVFNLITGMFPVTSGKITYKKKEITNKPAYHIYQSGISRTFQDIRLFGSMNVLENILVAQSQKLKRRLRIAPLGWFRDHSQHESISDVIRLLGLVDYIHQFPKDLPAGIKRIVELARVLSSNSELVLLDEPSSGMNPTEADNLKPVIKSMRENGLTLFIVGHDMDLVMGLCDYVFVMNYGKKIAEGTPEEVQNNQRVLEAYLGRDEDSARGL